MAFRNRFLIVTLGVLCLLAPQVLLQYSPGVFGIGVRCLFVVSDVIALLGIMYGQKSVSAWRSYAILYAVRCAATIPLILWLRSVTGSVGDGLYLLGYVPAAGALAVATLIAVAVAAR